MADKREYGYQIRGNQLSIVEKDFTTSDGLNYVYDPITNPGIDIPSESAIYKSPLEAITDGLELEYAYSPEYRINDADDTVTATGFSESSGLLQIDGTFALSKDDYIVISGSEKWNGLHKVNADTANSVVLTTKYNGGPITEALVVSVDVSALSDENSEIDLPSYLAKALVYFVKAKIQEDLGNIDMREYFMREFKRALEKHENRKISGPRMIMGGSHAIR